MKINEARFRQILREEARRVRLFEADADGGAAPVAAAPAAAPAATPAAGTNTPDSQLEADLNDIMFGTNGYSTIARRAALFSSDLVFDAPMANLQQGSDDGDMSDLGEDVQKNIRDEVLKTIKTSGDITDAQFHDIVVKHYSESFPKLDPPEKEDAISRPGTDTFMSAIKNVIAKWKRAGGSTSSAAAPPPTPPGSDSTGGAGGDAGATYKIARGDTLSNITQRFYGRGDPAAYKALAVATGIQDPNKITTGQSLKLPPFVNVGGKNVNLIKNAAPVRGSTGALSENRRRVSIIWGR